MWTNSVGYKYCMGTTYHRSVFIPNFHLLVVLSSVGCLWINSVVSLMEMANLSSQTGVCGSGRASDSELRGPGFNLYWRSGGTVLCP